MYRPSKNLEIGLAIHIFKVQNFKGTFQIDLQNAFTALNALNHEVMLHAISAISAGLSTYTIDWCNAQAHLFIFEERILYWETDLCKEIQQ